MREHLLRKVGSLWPKFGGLRGAAKASVLGALLVVLAFSWGCDKKAFIGPTAVLVGDVLIVQSYVDGRGALYCFDKATGTQLWAVRLQGHFFYERRYLYECRLVATAEQMVTYDGAGSFLAVTPDRANAKPSFRRFRVGRGVGAYADRAIGDELLFWQYTDETGGSDSLRSLDLKTGAVRTNLVMPYDCGSSALLVTDDGFVCDVGRTENGVVWTTALLRGELGADGTLRTSLAHLEGERPQVLVGFAEGLAWLYDVWGDFLTVYAATTGRLMHKTGRIGWRGFPLLLGNRAFLLVPEREKAQALQGQKPATVSLACLDARTGRAIWKCTALSPTDVPFDYNGLTAVGSLLTTVDYRDSTVWAWSRRDGRVAWHSDPIGRGFGGTVVAGGALYVVRGNVVAALEAENGHVQWTNSIEPASGSPLARHGVGPLLIAAVVVAGLIWLRRRLTGRRRT